MVVGGFSGLGKGQRPVALYLPSELSHQSDDATGGLVGGRKRLTQPVGPLRVVECRVCSDERAVGDVEQSVERDEEAQIGRSCECGRWEPGVWSSNVPGHGEQLGERR